MTRSPTFSSFRDTCLRSRRSWSAGPTRIPRSGTGWTAAFLHDETYRRPKASEIEATYEQRENPRVVALHGVPELKAEIERGGIKSLAEFYTSDAKVPARGVPP